jgi:hypothetical protein
MKYLVYPTLFSVILFSCNSQDQQNTAEAEETTIDSSQMRTGTELPENTISMLSNEEIYRTDGEDEEINWNNFKLTKFWREDSPLVRTFEPTRGYYETYGPFLVYSPDSTHFIDLDSYNVQIRKTSNGKLAGNAQGPDTEVSLVDRNNKKRIRLLFFGPGGSIEDAKWIDNETLLLIGTVEGIKDGELNAGIFRYHIPTKSFQVYETADKKIITHLKGYSSRERLKQVNMR